MTTLGGGNLLEAADWTFPVPISYGPGRLRELAATCASAGMTNPLVVTDQGSVDLPFIGTAMDLLGSAGLGGDLFAGISPNPTDADATVGREVFVRGGHDGVVAIGGGSGMDGGKAISLTARCDLPIDAFDYNEDTPPMLPSGALVPLVCIPTTAGTGAETESTAMITMTELGVKICIAHPDQRPAAAILDPELTIGLPSRLTAWTGIDALVHAIEAYAVPDWHPLCDGLALQAIRLLWPALPLAVDEGSNLEARAAMLVGSCLAGVSFLKGLGLVHATSHMIGAVYDTHHGLTNAVMLPPVLEFNKDVLGAKTEQMALAMGLSDTSHESFAGAIDNMLDRLEIPVQLRELGVEAERIPELATKAMADSAAATNPRAASKHEIEMLLSSRL